MVVHGDAEAYKRSLPRVLFTGGRNFVDRRAVRGTIDELIERLGDFWPVVGDCPTGADLLVKECLGVWEVHVANWFAYGNRAGPMRNQAMVDAGASLCVVFPGGKGTKDCERRARKAGIPVWHPVDGEAMPEVRT